MLYEMYPGFEQYYDTEKNIRPFQSFAYKSAFSVWWKCKIGHSFEHPISSFTISGKFRCPICDNMILQKGFNDLLSCDEELASEYDVKKNKKSPDEVLISSTDTTTWWTCSKEGHEFQRSVNYRFTRTKGCPICNNRLVIKGVNDYASQYPDILKIWDTEKTRCIQIKFRILIMIDIILNAIKVMNIQHYYLLSLVIISNALYVIVNYYKLGLIV